MQGLPKMILFKELFLKLFEELFKELFTNVKRLHFSTYM